MKPRHLPNRIAGVVLGFTLMLLIGAASSTTGRAQYRDNDQGRRGRNWDGYPKLGGSYELRQTALNAGYNEGLKAGRDDRRRGRYNPQGSSAFRNASKDYNSRYGDRYAYQQYFRDAFNNGYSDGYNYGY